MCNKTLLINTFAFDSYTTGCPPVRGDNPRALASGLSYVQVDIHGITIYTFLFLIFLFIFFVTILYHILIYQKL